MKEAILPRQSIKTPAGSTGKPTIFVLNQNCIDGRAI
jgi:hypothetical protein